MAEFGLALSDTGVRETLEELRERGTSERVEVVGSNVEYAVYLEFGTEDMPPYPWFRPAIREFRANPERFIVDQTRYASLDEIPTVDALVTAVAESLVAKMKKNATAQGSVDRSPGTDAEHPRVQTGTLRNSIQAVRLG